MSLSEVLGAGQNVADGFEADDTESAKGILRLYDTWESVRAGYAFLLVYLVAIPLGALVVSPGLVSSLSEGKAPEGWRESLLKLCGCAIGPVLARLCYVLISRRAARQALAFKVPHGLANSGVVLHSWAYERARACRSLSRGVSFANMWGLSVAIVLLVGLAFADGKDSSKVQFVADSAIAAASARFLIDFGRICARTANHDVNQSMFAEAVRALVSSVLAVVALALIAPGNAGEARETSVTAVGLGVMVAIIGLPVFEYVRDRAALMIVGNPPDRPRLTPLTAISGLSASEIERLNNEGLDSVEALVNTPMSRIFLGTRFGLKRIADWQDKGLLLQRFGVAACAELASRAGLSGILALHTLCEKDCAGATALLKKVLRLETDAEASVAVNLLRVDPDIALLRDFSQTIVIAVADDRA